MGLHEGQFRITGIMLLYNNMLQDLFAAQIRTIGFTVAALTLMFMLLFRSIKVALVAIGPNVLSCLAVLGVMGLSGTPLDMMTITIVAISIGIAVDDTIHYLHRFRAELARDGDYIAAMHRCHRSIGNAICYTTATVALGFSILVLSSFIPSVPVRPIDRACHGRRHGSESDVASTTNCRVLGLWTDTLILDSALNGELIEPCAQSVARIICNS